MTPRARLAQAILLIPLLFLLVACGVSVAERISAGNRQYQRQNYDAALSGYQDAQVVAPDRPEGYFNAASSLVGSQEFERAVDNLEQAIEYADGELAERTYYNLGNVYFEMRMYGKAIDAYKQALLLNPDDDAARYNLELALLRYVPPTPTALEMQTEPELGQTDPETTPTNEPGGLDGPTPTPPPQDFDLTATPISGQGGRGDEDSPTPIPQSEGEMTVEQAEQLLDQIQQDQQSLREYLEEEAEVGEPSEKDW